MVRGAALMGGGEGEGGEGEGGREGGDEGNYKVIFNLTSD